MNDTLLQPRPIVPARLLADTVVLAPYWPFVRRIQALVAPAAKGKLPHTIPCHYVRTESMLILGPLVGAPAAAILMEGLVAGGIRRLIVFGVCGSIHQTLRIGDILLVDSAHSAEGTSRHYFPEQTVFPGDAALSAEIQDWLDRGGWPYQTGPLVSTDAPYRETPAWISRYQAESVQGIDMELSAIYALGQFYKVQTAGLMIVSDELFNGQWQSGFHSDRFRIRCEEMLLKLAHEGLKPWPV